MTATTQPAWWREPTRKNWIAFGAAWSGWVLDGFDFTIFLLAMPDIVKAFGVTYQATAWSITLTLLFRLAGGLGAGWLADRVGRKLPLMLSVILFALCDGAVYFAPTFTAVLVLRTLFGLGMGAQWTAGATLAMESWPQRSRGLASGVLQGSWAIGFILAGVAYSAVVPTHGWRTLFLVAAAPGLLVIPILLWVEESPDWRKAREAASGIPFSALLRGALLVRIAWASLLWAASFGIYYGLTALYSTLIQTGLGLPPATLRDLVILFNLGMMAGAIACGLAASRLGVVVALAVPIALLLPVLPLYVGAAPGWLWLGALLAGAFGAGISGVTPLLLTALFPPEIRARSVGVVYHAGALLAAGTPSLVAALWKGGLPLPHALAGVVAGAAVLTLAILVIRPRSALHRRRSRLRGAPPQSRRARARLRRSRSKGADHEEDPRASLLCPVPQRLWRER
ncbi:MAG: MFS transporter [Anaeromyxobacter sp.]